MKKLVEPLPEVWTGRDYSILSYKARPRFYTALDPFPCKHVPVRFTDSDCLLIGDIVAMGLGEEFEVIRNDFGTVVLESRFLMTPGIYPAGCAAELRGNTRCGGELNPSPCRHY